MKKIKMLGFYIIGIVAGLLLLLAVARLAWHSKFYPGVSIARIAIGGLTREQAKEKVEQASATYQMKLQFNGSEWVVPQGAILYEIDESLNNAYHYGRRAQFGDYLLLLVNQKTNYPLLSKAGQTEKMDLAIKEIAESIEIAPIDPTILVVGQKVQINNGVDGVLLDSETLEIRINGAASNLDAQAVVMPTLTAKRQLSQQQVEVLQGRAEKLLGDALTLVLDDEKAKLGGKELVSLLSTESQGMIVDEEAVAQYVVGLGDSFNKEPQDARFAFEDGKVQEFAPGKDGVRVSEAATAEKLASAIETLLISDNKNETVEVAAVRTPPQVTTDKVNELGIKERIGRGESYYAHSIPNRIFNVGLAAQRANSALIAPGEEFSFNKVVGEISGATGYREAYVISGGRTVLGDGGGVCQVSTTLFRGAMSAGLPITERWGHAYRVGYYEQNSKPGIDATVYAPSKDMRFKNDTPGHILVQTINDPKTLHLVVEIYGTSDGRVATVSEPKIWGIAPPPPDIIQEDPSLPSGTTKQVDWAAGGAKTSFEYKVVRNGETLQEKTFTTSYKPWANVYLKGTGQ